MDEKDSQKPKRIEHTLKRKSPNHTHKKWGRGKVERTTRLSLRSGDTRVRPERREGGSQAGIRAGRLVTAGAKALR